MSRPRRKRRLETRSVEHTWGLNMCLLYNLRDHGIICKCAISYCWHLYPLEIVSVHILKVTALA